MSLKPEARSGKISIWHRPGVAARRKQICIPLSYVSGVFFRATPTTGNGK